MLAPWLTHPVTRTQAAHDPAGEVVELCRELIRIDTSNYGDDSGPGERKAAEYVATLLDEVGIESDADRGRRPGAPRWSRSGAATEGDGLLLHGHLDVVPAAAEDWQVDPFSGEIQDGYVWGRGAVDMKDFDAMLLVDRPRPPARPVASRRGRSRCASPPTRRPAATRARRRSSRTTPSCSRAAPRRSARSAASARPSAAGGST